MKTYLFALGTNEIMSIKYLEQNLLRMSLKGYIFVYTGDTAGGVAGTQGKHLCCGKGYGLCWRKSRQEEYNGIKVLVMNASATLLLKSTPKHMRTCSPGHLWSSSKESYRWGIR